MLHQKNLFSKFHILRYYLSYSHDIGFVSRYSESGIFLRSYACCKVVVDLSTATYRLSCKVNCFVCVNKLSGTKIRKDYTAPA